MVLILNILKKGQLVNLAICTVQNIRQLAVCGFQMPARRLVGFGLKLKKHLPALLSLVVSPYYFPIISLDTLTHTMVTGNNHGKNRNKRTQASIQRTYTTSRNSNYTDAAPSIRAAGGQGRLDVITADQLCLRQVRCIEGGYRQYGIDLIIITFRKKVWCLLQGVWN